MVEGIKNVLKLVRAIKIGLFLIPYLSSSSPQIFFFLKNLLETPLQHPINNVMSWVTYCLNYWPIICCTRTTTIAIFGMGFYILLHSFLFFFFCFGNCILSLVFHLHVHVDRSYNPWRIYVNYNEGEDTAVVIHSPEMLATAFRVWTWLVEPADWLGRGKGIWVANQYHLYVTVYLHNLCHSL